MSQMADAFMEVFGFHRIGDCPTFRWSHDSECHAPAYKTMSGADSEVFWNAPLPCALCESRECAA